MYPPHDLGGGYELTWQSWVRHARRQGDAVRVLTTDWRRPGLSPDTESDEGVHRDLRWYWRDHEFPRLGLRKRLTIERHNGSVLSRHLREFMPDAVSWWGMGGMSLSLLERVKRTGVPAVGVVGDEWLRWGPRADAWTRLFSGRPRLARLAERRTGLPTTFDLAGSAHWLFNSEAVRDAALEANPGLEDTAVAHPGIDEALFAEPAPTRRWDWSLLYLGRLDRRKGVHIAVESLRHLPGEARLLLQGDGDAEYTEELRRLAERLGLADRLSFSAEPRAAIPAVYAAADAVLFPVQWEEPWGLVPLEAMAMGRPVVATGSGGSSEYLQDGVNCLVFAPRDSPRALAAAVKRLAADPSLLGGIRESGLRTARRFTETAYNNAISDAIQKAVG